MYDAIVACKYSMDGPGWKDVSEEGKALVSKLLQKDQSVRLSLDQVLESPWMQSADLDKKVLEQTHKDLRAFNAKRKWKSSILAVVATNRVKTIGDLKVSASKRSQK
jgi:serine/threonine protein kinase